MKMCIHAANYLLQLYTGQVYKFNRRKAMALLFFSDLALLIDDKPSIIIDEPIIFNHNGIIIKSVAEHFIFFCRGSFDERIKIDYNKPQPINNNFREDYRYDPNILIESHKKVIFKLFTEFGAYDEYILMKIIRKFNIAPISYKKDMILYHTNKKFDSYIYYLKKQKIDYLKESNHSITGTEFIIQLIYSTINKYKI